MTEDCKKKLTEEEAARAVSRGCHWYAKPLGNVQHLESFPDVLGKLRRNCRYTISDAASKRFAKARAKT